jgi:hypothetical protein
MKYDEVIDAARRAYRRHYDEDGDIGDEPTEDMAAGLCLVLGLRLHGVTEAALFGAAMAPALVRPLCEQMIAEIMDLA